MAGLIHDRVGTGALRISMNRGSRKASSKKIVVDGSRGDLFSMMDKDGLAKILGSKVEEDLEDRILRMGTYIMDTLRGDGLPALMTGLARNNWQISRVRSARSVGHLTRLINRDDVIAQNINGWKRQRELGWKWKDLRYRGEGERQLIVGRRMKLSTPSEVGLTDFINNFSIKNGDYGFIITNNVPYIQKMVYGNSSTRPLLPLADIIYEAVEEAKTGVPTG